MAVLSDAIQRGTLAARPAASIAGRLYYDTTNSILYRDSGSAWESVEAGAQAPAAHAASHHSGGSDALALGSIAGTLVEAQTPLTTKGDLLVSDGTLLARVPVGTDNQVLTADAAQALGVKWAAAAGGAWTIIADTVLATVAASVTFSSIPATYRHLALMWSARNDTGASTVLLRCNGDTTANYDGVIIDVFGTSTAVVTTAAGTSIRVGSMASPTGGWSGGVIELFDYASTATGRDKTVLARASRKDSNASPDIYLEHTSGWWRTTATAITSLTLLPGGNNFAIASKFTLYGISA